MTWKTVRLEDVCTIYNGGTPKSKTKSYWEGDIKWLTPKDMGKLDGKFVSDTARKITHDGLNNSSAKLVPANSVILSCRAPIGHVFINECDMSFNQGCKGLVPSNEILVEYLYYFLFSSKQLLNDLGTGTTFKEISSKTLSNVSFSYPPLAEQERIVAKLDAAFAEIDRGIEVVKEGLENINVLQKNYIDNLFKSISGEKTILENVTSALTCGVAKRPNYTDKGVPFLSARNVKNGKMKWENYKYVDNDTHLKLTKYNKPEIGDILYSRVGAGFGDAAIIDKNIEFSIFVSLTLIKPDKELHNEYLCHYLNSSFVKKLAASSITGTGVGNLNVGAVRKFPITIISKEQQILVSEKINVFLKKLDKLKFINKKKINSLQALKSAMLSQELQSSEAA
ncbi:restriction endonuclease subunit S [Gammaproteobacteria bacterium]|nr:restriction endonuclease subunit S [Gammaproteobacteria bacterium]